MTAKAQQFRKDLLALCEEDRAELAQVMMEYGWQIFLARSHPFCMTRMKETLRRAAELDADPSMGITLEDLDRHIDDRRR